MQTLGKNIGQLERSRHQDQLHLSILDDFVGEVLPDVNVLGSLTAANDVVSSFNTRRVVFVDRVRFLLPEAESVQKCPEVQDLTARR